MLCYRQYAASIALIRTLVLLGFMVTPVVSQAQIKTAITSSGLGTVVTIAPGGRISITGGTPSDRNLFHSFGSFSVGTNDIAVFQNTTGISITNILGRVTGGQPSSIFGTINTSTAFPGANLFLINPAGVIFGPTAKLDVGGSFHVSTADSIGFGVGKTFSLTTSGEQVKLLSAEPTDFGFLALTPVRISIAGSSLAVPPGKTLSVVGGEAPFPDDSTGATGLTISGPAPLGKSTLGAPSGRIQIASVASAGQVTLDPDLNAGSFTRLGRIDMPNGARLDVSGNGGGTVLIRGGR
jgi:filamentous hemagglutinin family protein